MNADAPPSTNSGEGGGSSDEEDAAVRAVVPENVTAWIGATHHDDLGDWMWDTNLIVNYTNWVLGQPDNANATDDQEDCAAYNNTNVTAAYNTTGWEDYHCLDTRPFVCMIIQIGRAHV